MGKIKFVGLALILCVSGAWAGNTASENYTGTGATISGDAPNINSVTLMSVPPGSVLFDNGPIFNSAGTGTGGADESILENSTLGMTTLGFGHQVSISNRIADDFTITTPGGWDIEQITFYAYQTGSTTTSTFTAVNLRIWNGIPGGVGSQIVWGDDSTNIMTATGWSGAYRAAESTPGDTSRPIMANEVAVITTLGPGTYWLDWQADGTLGSGPWAPPIATLGQTTVGRSAVYRWRDAISSRFRWWYEYPYRLSFRDPRPRQYFWLTCSSTVFCKPDSMVASCSLRLNGVWCA